MKVSDGLSGVNKIPRLPRHSALAKPVYPVQEGSAVATRILHGFHLVFWYLTFHHYRWQWCHNLAGQRVPRNRGKKQNRLNRVDFDVRWEI